MAEEVGSVVELPLEEDRSMAFTQEEHKVIRLELSGDFKFVPASAQELEYIANHHPELCGVRVFEAEISRITRHLFIVEATLVITCRLHAAEEQSIERGRREAQLKGGRCVDPASIQPAEGTLDDGSICGICRGAFGNTCDSPSIVKHDHCSCNGLQVYGKECLQRAFEFDTRCPNCRGNIKDEVLAQQALEDVKVKYDQQQALLSDKVECQELRLVSKSLKLGNQTYLLKFMKKTQWKLRKAGQLKKKSTTRYRTGTVMGGLGILVGIGRNTTDQIDGLEDVFSQGYIKLMRDIALSTLRYRNDSKIDEKAYFRHILYHCESAIAAIGHALHSSIARTNIQQLVDTTRSFLEKAKKAIENPEDAPFTLPSSQQLIEALGLSLEQLASKRKTLMKNLNLSKISSLHPSQITALRYFQNIIDKKEAISIWRQWLLLSVINGLKSMVENQCQCESAASHSYQCWWVESLADICINEIVVVDALMTVDSNISKDRTNVVVVSKLSKMYLAEWEHVYLRFRIEELLAKYREEKPEGWVENEEVRKAEEGIGDEVEARAELEREELEREDVGEDEPGVEEFTMARFPTIHVFLR